MKKIFLQLLILFCTLALTQVSGLSQTIYSLKDLILIANKLSETIKIAEEDLEIAIQDKQRAFSVLVPRATTYGSATRHKNEEQSLPDTTTVGIKFTQSFTLNGKELIAFDVTKKNIETKEFSLQQVRSEYLLQVSQAYYNILSAERLVEIAQSDVERLATYRDSVKEKLSVGNVTKTDLFRAEAELSKSETDLVVAENDLLQAKAALVKLVDIDLEFELVREPIERIAGYDTSLEEIQTFALNNRPEIKEARKNVEIAEQTIKFEKGDFWPSVSLEAGYKETDIEYEGLVNDVRYDDEDLYVTGELTFTLFDGGLRKAEVRQAVSQLKKAKQALSLQEKEVVLGAKVSFLQYDTAKSALINLQDELKSARENLNAVKMQFKYGMADSITIMDANTLLVTAERRISTAEYALYQSIINILYTRGDLTSFLLTSID